MTAIPLSPAPASTLMPQTPLQVAQALVSARAERLPLLLLGERGRAPEGRALPGVSPPYLALSTLALKGVLELSEASLWMTVRAGTLLAQAATEAHRRGLRLVGRQGGGAGTVGGWLATGGRVADRVLGMEQEPILALEAALPSGHLVRAVTAPRKATGPDHFGLFLGTWGAFGAITAATLKLEPLPEAEAVLGFAFPTSQASVEWMRTLQVCGFPPAGGTALLRLGAEPAPAEAAVLYDGGRRIVAVASARAAREALRLGGTPLAEPVAQGLLQGADRGDEPPQVEGNLRWSQLFRGLATAPAGQVPARRMVDRAGLCGARLRIWAEAAPLDRDLFRLLEADGAQVAAVAQAREVLERVRRELDPAGLVNPHAWPLPWPRTAGPQPAATGEGT